jgi:hypothetical protein
MSGAAQPPGADLVIARRPGPYSGERVMALATIFRGNERLKAGLDMERGRSP